LWKVFGYKPAAPHIGLLQVGRIGRQRIDRQELGVLQRKASREQASESGVGVD
jgi:hypothetical protein